MGEFHINGGNKISGRVRINGAKNAVLPILAATVLSEGVSVIHDCPRISDTFVSIDILESLGCKVEMEGHTIIVDSSSVNNIEIPENLVKEMRSSIIFLGGLLGRFRSVKICYPGGCELGLRPIDLHLKGFEKMGVEIVEGHGYIKCETEKLIGAKINLDFSSVGATENLMLAGVLAEGETIISNAAREPEIVDLEKFLNSMGAKVKGAGTDTIVIKGVKKLTDSQHCVLPDRIVAGTLFVATALTKGSISLENVVSDDLFPITSKLAETGCIIKDEGKRISLKAPSILKPITRLRTHPHPGFPTDMQAQMMTLLALAKGTSLIEETLFESRNKHVAELVRMGADILLGQDGMTFVVKGVDRLEGATVSSKDLRGGAALVLAGLVAEGKTIVTDTKHIERGYENFHEMLKNLGADISFKE